MNSGSILCLYIYIYIRDFENCIMFLTFDHLPSLLITVSKKAVYNEWIGIKIHFILFTPIIIVIIIVFIIIKLNPIFWKCVVTIELLDQSGLKSWRCYIQRMWWIHGREGNCSIYISWSFEVKEYRSKSLAFSNEFQINFVSLFFSH